MASFRNYFLFFFFFLVLLFSASPTTQARESQFFSKFTHVDTQIKSASESKVSSPAPAPEPVYEGGEPTHAGSFGPGSGLVVPTKETTTSGPNTTPFSSTTAEDELLNEQLYSATPESTTTGYQSSNNYKNSGYATANYYNNGYESVERQGMSDTRFLEGGKYYHDVKKENDYPGTEYESGKVSTQNQANGYSGNYDNNGYRLASSSYETGSQNTHNGYTNNNYNNNVYGNERQGMSDTRFVEGGKYSYDAKNEKYYYPANGYASGTQDRGYYGNTVGTNEFNNMEKFENQEEFEESGEESFP